MKKTNKDSKKILFEMMYKVGKMPLRENYGDDDYSDDNVNKRTEIFKKKFVDLPENEISVLAQDFINSGYDINLMGLNKWIRDNHKNLYLNPNTMHKLVDIIGNPDLKNQWVKLSTSI